MGTQLDTEWPRGPQGSLLHSDWPQGGEGAAVTNVCLGIATVLATRSLLGQRSCLTEKGVPPLWGCGRHIKTRDVLWGRTSSQGISFSSFQTDTVPTTTSGGDLGALVTGSRVVWGMRVSAESWPCLTLGP